ncbi:TPA: SDR family oxidoreductase [Candidatus Bathyarchaeota archaeon]|nr:SDR family oxidoreductase [Candidatus Bathyarchaeota archaeon]
MDSWLRHAGKHLTIGGGACTLLDLRRAGSYYTHLHHEVHGDVGQPRRSLEQDVPLKRLGRPEEIAKGSLYLACDDSSFMNGATLVIDGGATA